MKTKNWFSKVFTLVAFVFVCIIAISSTNAWLTKNPTKTTFVITYGEVNFQLIGNSTSSGFSPSAEDVIADSKTPANDKGFMLPKRINPNGTYNQIFKTKNIENSTIYVRVRFTTFLDDSTSAAADEQSLKPDTTWTYNSGYYSATIAGGATIPICTQMKVGSIENSTFVRLKIEVEAASANNKFVSIV